MVTCNLVRTNEARKAAGQGRAVHRDGEGSILLYLGRGGGGALRHLSTQAQRRLVEVEERLLLLALGAFQLPESAPQYFTIRDQSGQVSI